MLTDSDIKRHGLVEDGVDRNYRSASYDLRIGQMIDPSGEIVSSYNLPPQGIVEVISRERIRTPLDISGFAMVKTRMCQEGILALSIGIIDPGFEGRISSFLVNFGNHNRLLQKDEIFLRTTFQKLDSHPESINPIILNDQEMLRDRRRTSVEKFERTFLSIDSVASKSAEKVVQEYKKTAITYFAVGAFALAVLTFFVNFGTIWLKWQEKPAVSVDAARLEAELKALSRQNDTLSARLKILEKRSSPPSEEGQPR